MDVHRSIDSTFLYTKHTEKRKSIEITFDEKVREQMPCAEKKRASPIIFDVDKKESERQGTETTSSENHLTVTTITNSHKYNSVPSWPQLMPCQMFPNCPYGDICAYAHPRCKFDAYCKRHGCVYKHKPRGRKAAFKILSSSLNYKRSSSTSLSSICKFSPNCMNPSCRFFHPKPCRYDDNCVNKHICVFFHSASVGKRKLSHKI